jgi:hypothetical protein
MHLQETLDGYYGSIRSGPTTAGVLRGEKARFQLFGDGLGYSFPLLSHRDINLVSY